MEHRRKQKPIEVVLFDQPNTGNIESKMTKLNTSQQYYIPARVQLTALKFDQSGV